MKKIITLLVFIVTSSVYAQNSGITYQAVIYNPSSEILPGNNNPNVVLAEKNICLRFSISDANSSIEYQEVQKVKTDEFGMVNLIVGDGDQVSGYAANFDAIIWNSSNKNLKVEIDTNGNCTNFIEISNQKFASVPFAFASKVAETVSGIVPIVNGGTGAATVAGAKTNLGLNNVDNTSDLNKPVSTATQTALDAKAPLASPGFTGIPTAPTAAAGTSTTQIATTAFVNAALATAASPDATATQKGRIQLAGDLGGTADAPTVPGLANKENAANKSTDISLGNSDILFPTQKAVKTYVDNQVSAGAADADTTRKGIVQLTGDLGGTADAPTVPGLLSKEPTITAGTISQYYRGDKSWQNLDKTAVGLNNVDNTSDANKPVSTATQTALNAKENTITPGTTAQYWRGDKTWQTLEKTAVGLGNVNNTADLDKPVSTATQTALNAKENAANKSDVTTLGLSDVLFPTQKAVKTYVDTEINAKATPDATASDKGKIQLAGDLAGTGSYAASPVITNNAISTNKIANDAVTTVKIAPGSTNSVLVTDATGVVAWLDKGAFGAVADLASIEGVGTTANPFKIKDLGVITAKLANGAVTTVKLADDAVTNAKIGEIIAVENGGTGSNMATTAGYVKQATTGANFSTVSTIPVADVDGAVRKVNGVTPDANGNVAVIIGRVFTGTTFNPNSAASVIAINSGPNPIKESDIYIVSGQSGTPNDNGRTFINDGTNWLEISTNVAALESTFVKLSGSTMAGNLDFPTGKKIIIADAPTGSTDAVNKAYVDGLVTSSATPDATAAVKGKIQLAGDLSGTADTPTVPGLANKENTIATGTTSQYWRGDKTWQTLDKSAVGLSNVDNTADIDKPISTTVQNALNAKEDTANKSTATTLGTSDVLFPTQNAVKTYVDIQITNATPDATTTSKGKIQLAGDLGGTADAPTVPGLATKQDALTLTTTGSGNATLTGATLNIPPQSNKTPFNLQGTNTDVGDNKTDRIWRTGGIMLGDGVSSTTNFNGYFFARGNMVTNPTIFAFENTQTAGTGIFVGNGGGSNFLPNFRMSSSSTFRSIMIGEIQTDSGSDPALQFRAQLQGLGPIVNRPTFTWVNGGVGGTEQMRLTADGRLAINNTAPIGRLIVDDKSYITNLPASTANLMDNTTFRPHTRFQNTVGANNNALSLYSTTAAWGIQSHNYTTGAALPFVLQPASGFVGVNIPNPVSTFANTSTVISGSNISSAINGGFTWVASGTGFAAGIYNANADGNGFLIKNNATGATNNVLEVATGTQNTTVNSLLNVKGNGNVGIGTNSPISKFEVNGSATNTAAFNNGGSATAIAFSMSNLAYTTLSPQLFALTGIKDGGTYTLAVQGPTQGTSTFIAPGFTFRYVNNGPSIANTHTLYTFVVMGTTVYVYTTIGFTP